MIAIEQQWTRLRVSTGLSKVHTQWPDAESSIGTWFRAMGSNDCWEAIGPALETYRHLSKELKAVLEERSDYLYENVPVPQAVTFGVYMIGRRKTSARPTIMVCCQIPTPRKRAKQLIKESAILNNYPGFALGDSSYPPDFDRPPVQLAAGNTVSGLSVDRSNGKETVFYQPANKLYGIPIFLPEHCNSTALTRKATIGGIVLSQGRAYGLTVAHAFTKPPESPKTVDGQVFEYDIDDGSSFIDEDSIEVTSRGSATPEHGSPQSGRESRLGASLSDNSSIIYADPIYTSPAGSRGMLATSHLQDYDTVFDTSIINQNPSMLALDAYPRISRKAQIVVSGKVVRSSEDGFHSSLDWALVEIRATDIPHYDRGLLSDYPRFQRPKQVVTTGPKNTGVLAVTGSGGILIGTLSGVATFRNTPYCITFQEVWTVQLEGKLEEGDCGSWVIDAESGDLYGHIIAGSPSGTGYIIPAQKIFDDVQQQLGSELLFGSRSTTNLEAVTPLVTRENCTVAAPGTDSCASSPAFDPDTEISLPSIFPLELEDDFSAHKFAGRYSMAGVTPELCPSSGSDFSSYGIPTPKFTLHEQLLPVIQSFSDPNNTCFPIDFNPRAVSFSAAEIQDVTEYSRTSKTTCSVSNRRAAQQSTSPLSYAASARSPLSGTAVSPALPCLAAPGQREDRLLLAQFTQAFLRL